MSRHKLLIPLLKICSCLTIPQLLFNGFYHFVFLKWLNFRLVSQSKRKAMKPALILSLGLLLVFSSCLSPSKLVEMGDYDKAIDVSIQRLTGKKKKKAELVKTLESAFEKATRQDMRLAESLEKEGRPENWERINDIHRQIGRRQSRIEPLLPLVDENGYQARFQFVRIDELEQKSRENAAEYFYNRALALLDQAKKGDKPAAREAFNELQ